MILRPQGVVLAGRLTPGLEVEIQGSTIRAVRPLQGEPEPYVVSPAFVNAHSHLEYRGLQGAMPRGLGYVGWIRAITEAKRGQDMEAVRRDCHVAARENRLTGVAWIGEHSDRPFSGEAMAAAGLSGVIFQEVITFLEYERPEEKIKSCRNRLDQNVQSGFTGEGFLSPHAPYTVDPGTLSLLASQSPRLSIHVAESPAENEFFMTGRGSIGEMFERFGVTKPAQGVRSVEYLAGLGYLRPGVQFVHACDIDDREINLIARAGVAVVHCPRSNAALDCPPAPVRKMLDAGVKVGLGMDSAASSGPIDMFKEMASCLDVSVNRREPVTAEEAWNLATEAGAESLGLNGWKIAPGCSPPLIALRVPGAKSTRNLIEQGSLECVEWIEASR